MKTYRDQARKRTALDHCARNGVADDSPPGAAQVRTLFGVKPVLVPQAQIFAPMSPPWPKRSPTQTLFLVGSAPAYPHGVIDPIEALSDLALSRDLPLHVDACVGGFLLPFVRKLGFAVPPFDFAVPGVTSMSANLHKYGFAAKGASTVMYRTSGCDGISLRLLGLAGRTVWFGDGAQGTRPGGAIAAAWASLNALGESGYLRIARTIMDTTRAFIDGISAIPGLFVLGKPDCGVFALRQMVPVMAIADQMEDHGYRLYGSAAASGRRFL